MKYKFPLILDYFPMNTVNQEPFGSKNINVNCLPKFPLIPEFL